MDDHYLLKHICQKQLLFLLRLSRVPRGFISLPLGSSFTAAQRQGLLDWDFTETVLVPLYMFCRHIRDRHVSSNEALSFIGSFIKRISIHTFSFLMLLYIRRVVIYWVLHLKISSTRTVPISVLQYISEGSSFIGSCIGNISNHILFRFQLCVIYLMAHLLGLALKGFRLILFRFQFYCVYLKAHNLLCRLLKRIRLGLFQRWLH